MKITFDIGEPDYRSLVEFLLPLVADKLSDKESIGSIFLSKLASMPPSVAGSMVDILPQKTKNELVITLVSKNKDKIIAALLAKADSMDIKIDIKDIEIEV